MPADVAAATTERGDLVLRHRTSDGALELRVNGVFVMDDRETTTERLLARTTLEALTGGSPSPDQRDQHGPGTASGVQGLRVLIGGLGLGYTLGEILDSPLVESVLVAEIESDLVAWHTAGLVPRSRIADERVTVIVGDVQDVVTSLAPGEFDLMLLDVDNGPNYLVYDDNAAVYEPAFLTTCREVLRPGGVLAIWSADASAVLTRALASVFETTVEHLLPVKLQRRSTSYYLYLASR